MAALSDNRFTKRSFRQRQFGAKVKAATLIYNGGLVCADASGWAVPAADTANFHILGVAENKADNTAAGAANGDQTVECLKGVFKFDNAGGGQAIGQADIGKTAYVVDDHTVGKSSTNSVVAGVIDFIDADGGVWVAIL